MTVTDQTVTVTDAERQHWDAYLAWQRTQAPGSLLRTLPETVETVDDLLRHMLTALNAMIETWWAAHPELHAPETGADV